MKRSLKIIGLLSVIFILVGAVFKTMHWPGAGIIIVSGFFFFCFIFIPLNIILTFRDDKKTTNRIVMTLGMVLTMTGIFGLLFKVMHWPLANILFQGSLAVFGLVFIPLYFFTKTRNPETKFNAIINTTFMIAAAGIIFIMINLRPSSAHEEKQQKLKDVQLGIVAQLKTTNMQMLARMDVKSANQSTFLALSNRLNKTIDERNPEKLDDLKKGIEDYNVIIEELNQQSLKKIDDESLNFLPENIDLVQLQLISNENSYLCMTKSN